MIESNVSSIRIRVLLFAGVRGAIGKDFIELDVPFGTTVETLRLQLATQYPSIAELARRSRFADESEFLRDETEFNRSAEIAWIPPVSGG